jgi:hypothetical protein
MAAAFPCSGLSANVRTGFDGMCMREVPGEVLYRAPVHT